MDTKDRYNIKRNCTNCGSDINEDGDWQPRDPFMKYTHLIPGLNSYSGFSISDIDSFIWNRNTNISMIIECKQITEKWNLNYINSKKQTQMLFKINETFKNIPKELKQFQWRGTYLFRFANKDPKNGLTVIYRMENDGKFGERLATFNYDELYKFVELLLTTYDDSLEIIKKIQLEL